MKASFRGMAIAAAIGLASLATSAFAQTLPAPPAPGASARVDAIRKAGVLRVGVLSNPPWLVEDTTRAGEPWAGPAWLLAQEYAKLLGVKLQPVLVSHETKVPVIASNQVDMTISPLSATPERKKVVDFVSYSKTSICMFGRADNPKLAKITTVDELNSPDITIAYFTGGGEENWVKQRFPKAVLRGVSTAGSAAPVEEIIAKRADVSPINRVPWVALNRKVKGLTVRPAADNCQNSTELANDIGLAIDKNQPEYLAWLTAVADAMHKDLLADEERVTAKM